MGLSATSKLNMLTVMKNLIFTPKDIKFCVNTPYGILAFGLR
jgi:hypothetical protein